MRSVFNLNKLCAGAHSVDHVGDEVGSPNWTLFPAVFQICPRLCYGWILEMYPKEHSVNGSVGSKDHWFHLYFDILHRETGGYQLWLQVSWYQSSGDRRCLLPGAKQPLKKPSMALEYSREHRPLGNSCWRTKRTPRNKMKIHSIHINLQNCVIY